MSLIHIHIYENDYIYENTGTTRPWRSRFIINHSLGIGCVLDAVRDELAKELHAQNAVESHEEEKEDGDIVDLRARASLFSVVYFFQLAITNSLTWKQREGLTKKHVECTESIRIGEIYRG